MTRKEERDMATDAGTSECWRVEIMYSKALPFILIEIFQSTSTCPLMYASSLII